MTQKKRYQEDNRFKFTIIDDTDGAFFENIKPIYDFLYEKRIFTTKTVWVYPPRDEHSEGDCLQNPEYLKFIQDIKKKGYEIGLHNTGSGDYTREEILDGLEEFKRLLGEYPKIQINHSYNKDSIYGGYKRFNWPFGALIKMIYPPYAGVYEGDTPSSDYYWGDVHKRIIRFNRNHTTDLINTVRFDKYMPYTDPQRSECSNYWFSATFVPTPSIFNRIIDTHAIDTLESEKGICIAFCHLGFFMKDGRIDKGFRDAVHYMASKKSCVSMPVSLLLDEIIERRKKQGREPIPKIPWSAKAILEMKHLLTRYKYKHVFKPDNN